MRLLFGIMIRLNDTLGVESAVQTCHSDLGAAADAVRIQNGDLTPWQASARNRTHVDKLARSSYR
jgi:hypothetical protein